MYEKLKNSKLDKKDKKKKYSENKVSTKISTEVKGILLLNNYVCISIKFLTNYIKFTTFTLLLLNLAFI